MAQATAAIEAVFGDSRASDSIHPKRPTPVAVTFKRRRTVAAPSADDAVPQASDDEGGASDRRPRVFMVAQSPRERDEALADEVDWPVGVAQKVLIPKRRRRRDPVRTPSVVIRTVFATPEPVMASHDDVGPQPEVSAAPRYSGEYEQIMQALDSVRSTLRIALEARSFRIA